MTTHEPTPPNFEEEPKVRVSFAEFNPAEHAIDQVRGVGDGSALEQLAEVFDIHPENGEWTVDELGKLIGKIGPAKTLQDNIQQITELLPSGNGQELAIEWVERSGLLEPVLRNFEDPNAAIPDSFDVAVITGGVRNWMMRRAKLLIDLAQNVELGEVLLVAGTREMRTAEGDDVLDGDTEASYKRRVIAPMLSDAGLNVRLVTPDTKDGEEIAKVVAAEVGDSSVLVACNAGNWPQNGGQIMRSIGGDVNRVYVASDSFPVAKNNEPPATHQNPLTAVAIIARNLQEFERHKV